MGLCEFCCMSCIQVKPMKNVLAEPSQKAVRGKKLVGHQPLLSNSSANCRECQKHPVPSSVLQSCFPLSRDSESERRIAFSIMSKITSTVQEANGKAELLFQPCPRSFWYAPRSSGWRVLVGPCFLCHGFRSTHQAPTRGSCPLSVRSKRREA